MARPDIHTNTRRLSPEAARKAAARAVAEKERAARERQARREGVKLSLGDVLRANVEKLPSTVKGAKGRFVSVRKAVTS